MSVPPAHGPTVTAGAYTANWVLGGKLTFANALRLPALSGTLRSIRVNSKGAHELVAVQAQLGQLLAFLHEN